jgi:hypothetical protein
MSQSTNTKICETGEVISEENFKKEEVYDDFEANDCGFGCGNCIKNDTCSFFLLPFICCLSIFDCRNGAAIGCHCCGNK